MACNETSPTGPAIRQRIVEAVAATFATVATLQGRIFIFAPTAFDQRNLPAVNLRDTSETDDGRCGNCSQKTLSFSADILVAEKPGSDGLLRELLQAVQIALLANPNCDGLADETRLTRNQIAIGQAGYCASGCRLIFSVRYRVKL
jgi:hypothetical protein